MATFTLSATLPRSYDDAVEAVRTALGDQGFGILTEIDLKATLKTKLDVDVAPQAILGACRPALAYEALNVDPSIAAVLPCNVVVRALDDATTLERVRIKMRRARERLVKSLPGLGDPTGSTPSKS